MNGTQIVGKMAAVLVSCCLIVSYAGCTRPTARDGVRVDGESHAERIDRTVQLEELPSDQDTFAVYDLEAEMELEDTPVDPDDLVEEIESFRSDSVSVEEMAVEGANGSRHDLGYRIQIFASGELSTANAMKESALAKTGYPAYIEYEGGLYKVRVGDFPDRHKAAEARARLVEFYPDCWIVQTTVRR